MRSNAGSQQVLTASKKSVFPQNTTEMPAASVIVYIVVEAHSFAIYRNVKRR
jgi:hypothetical protein